MKAIVLEQPGKFTQFELAEPARPGFGDAIVRVLDSSKTSLMDQPAGTDGHAATDLGGTYLHHWTNAEQQQRLMIVYDPRRPQDVEP